MENLMDSPPSSLARRLQPAVVLGIAALLLAVSFWSALRYWTTPPPPRATATCASPAIQVAASEPVTVNVLNATNRPGLAAASARLIRQYGFLVATVQNDPTGKAVPESAVVRFGPDGEAGAQQLLPLVPGAVPVQDSRGDASVDLVLGDAFTALAATAPPNLPC